MTSDGARLGSVNSDQLTERSSSCFAPVSLCLDSLAHRRFAVTRHSVTFLTSSLRGHSSLVTAN